MSENEKKIVVDTANSEDIKCEKCDTEFFNEVYIIKRVSAFLSPTGKEMLVPMKLLRCASCDHINEEFLK